MRATWECVRFEKRRAQEELEVVNMKITCLQSNREGGAVVDRLMEEIKSYKTLLKCSVCHERQKEVNELYLSLSRSSFSLCALLWLIRTKEEMLEVPHHWKDDCI